MSNHIGMVIDEILANIVRDRKFIRDNPRDWDVKNKFIMRAISETLSLCGSEAENTYYRLKDLCESPIECLGFAALLRAFPSAKVVRDKAELKNSEWSIGIVPQMKFCGYRLDFGVLCRDNKAAYSLECDGRRFHFGLAMKEDIERTADLWKRGIIVHRVTGAALCRNPVLAIEPFVRKVWGAR